MNEEEFYQTFAGVETQKNELEGLANALKIQLDQVSKDLRQKSRTLELLFGLKTTPQMRDPGKNHEAVYFVKKVTERDVEKSDTPSLTRKCPSCEYEGPVVMTYDQTFDSPEGDAWAKVVYTLCPEHGANPFEEFSRDSRF